MNKSHSNFKKASLLLLFSATILVSILTISSCKKDSDEPTPNPIITAITPAEAFPGENVVITGSYFPTELLTATKVTIGTTEVTVVSATDTRIEFTVPDIAAGEYDVKIQNGLLSSGTKKFTVKLREIAITNFTASEYKIGSQVTITGENFGAIKENIDVVINGKDQEIVSVSNTEIKFNLVAKTFSGKITVKKGDNFNEQEVTSAEEMVYKESYREVAFNSDIFNISYLHYGHDNNLYVGTMIDGINAIIKLSANGVYIDSLYSTYNGIYDILLKKNNDLNFISAYRSCILYKLKSRELCDTILNLGSTFSQIEEDSNGILYITDRNNNKILKLNTDGSTSEYIDINEPSFFKIDAANNIFISSDIDQKIYRITPNGIKSDYYSFEYIYDFINHPLLGLFVTDDSQSEPRLFKIKNDNTTPEEITGLSIAPINIALTKDNDLIISSTHSGIKKLIIE